MNEYNIHELTMDLNGKSGIDVISILNEVLVKLKPLSENTSYMRLLKIHEANSLANYVKYAGGLLYFLNGNGMPGIGKDGLRVFSPVLRHLIEVGDLKETAEEYFL